MELTIDEVRFLIASLERDVEWYEQCHWTGEEPEVDISVARKLMKVLRRYEQREAIPF